MNRAQLPLNALRAFEASARHLSFSKAAAELCVTHSAVSQQVKQLEALLGRELFRRSNRGVQLTEVGQLLLPLLGEAFDRMGEALDGVKQAQAGDRISVTATPAFAAKWLIPRLAGWHAAQPDLPVHLQPSLKYLDLVGGEADIAIRCGIPPWKGLEIQPLLPIHMSPLCSPALLERHGPLKAPADLLRHTLIHADIAGHALGEEWRMWLRAAGIDDPGTLEGLSFHDPNLALQAAADGLGIAMGYHELAEREVAAGRLLYPFPLQIEHSYGYYLAFPADKAGSPKIEAFRAWILAEVNDSIRQST